MRIVNKTDYKTRELRSYIIEVMRECGVNFKHYWVEIEYQRGYRRGLGSYGRPWMKLFMTHGRKNLMDFCYVAAHEIQHNLNVRHKEMNEAAIRAPWEKYKDLWLEEHPKPKVKINPVQARAENARKYQRIWERKVKLASTMLKKWKKRVRYYEKKTHLNKCNIPLHHEEDSADS